MMIALCLKTNNEKVVFVSNSVEISKMLKDEIDAHKKNIYRNFSYKKGMKFLSKKNSERKMNMEESNLKECSFSEMDIKKFREFSRDTQIKIIDELLSKYGTNTEVAKHIKISRCTFGKLRKELDVYRVTKKETNEQVQEIKNDTCSENDKLQKLNTKIKLSFFNCKGDVLKRKLESIISLLEDNDSYCIDIDLI